MAADRMPRLTDHAALRLAQRNLRVADIEYVLNHGRRIRNGSAIFIHLGLRDIPVEDQRESRLRRLEGTILVLDPDSGEFLTTAYRNRMHGIRDIKRKQKYRLPDRFQA
jgi:hypothetical protein